MGTVLLTLLRSVAGSAHMLHAAYAEELTYYVSHPQARIPVLGYATQQHCGSESCSYARYTVQQSHAADAEELTY